jgi:site-specific DNA recombinase
MKKVVIYTRVSTDDQKENGFSLQDQEQRLRVECKRRGYEIVAHYQDDHSAKDFNRPKFQQFLTDLRSRKIKPEVFLCIRTDRFSRNFVAGYEMFLFFKKEGIVFETVENNVKLDSPESLLPFMFNMIIPQMDNERRALNTKRGMRQALKEGRFMWKAPKGYVNDKVGKAILIDKVEGPIIKHAFESFASGLYSAEQVRKMVQEKGLKITKQNFLNILRNPLYTGKIRVDKWEEEQEIIVDGLHEALISEEIFKQCQDILSGKKKKLSRLNTRIENLPLRGFLTCAKCGKKLTGSNSKSRSGSLHSYYHCQNNCKERFRADKANEVFTEYLKTFQICEEAQELYLMILSDVFKKNDADRGKEKAQIEDQITTLEKRLASLTDKFIDDQINKAEFESAKKRFENARNELLAKHVVLQPEGAALRKYLDFSASLSRNLSNFYHKADFVSKQQIIGSIFPETLIFEGENYRTTKINEAMQLICNVDKAFKETKNKKAFISEGLSSWAPPAGLEPATL